MRMRSLRLLAPLLLFALLFGACSDDDGGDTASGSEASASSSSDGSSEDTTGGTTADGVPVEDTVPNPKPPPPPDRTKYCEGWGRLMGVSDKEFDRNNPESVKAHYNELLGVARELLKVAPDDIRGALEITIAGAERIAASGDTSADDGDEVRVNGQRLQDYAAEHC